MSDASAAFFAAPVESFDDGASRFAFRRFGDPGAPALLLVHGFPLSGFTWRHVLPALAARFRCVVPDLVGLGDSEPSARSDLSWRGQAQRLAALVERLGLDRYALLAQDTGGSFARVLAAIHAPRVRSMVLLNTEMPGHRPPWIPLYQALMASRASLAPFRLLLRSRAFLRSPAAFGGCFVDLDRLDGEFHEHVVAPLLRDPRRLEGVRRYLRELRDWRDVDDFARAHGRLELPVRLIWGADDPTFPITGARAMARQFPRADLVEVPGAKLLVHEERPDEVARAAIEHVERDESPRAAGTTRP